MPHKANFTLLALLVTATCITIGCQPSISVTSSAQLAKTEVVPTVDTPLGKSGSAVWCATFQIAWNHLRDDVIGGELQIDNAQTVADRLNGSPVTESALPPGDYYAEAGRVEEGIIAKIHSQMSRQFPGVTPPDFEGAVGFVSYGYLDTEAAFTTPFEETKQPIKFSDSDGRTHLLNGFGLHHGTDWDLLKKQAEQVKVLFYEFSIDRDSGRDKTDAFGIGLTVEQGDHEIIIAVLPRPKNLRAGLDDLARRTEKTFSSQKLYETDVLAIPNISFYLNHEFAELQGPDKTIENAGEFQGLYLAKAWQSIKFRLDKDGVAVVSESGAVAGASPRNFIVNRPFLVVVKRRSVAEPYFAAWIDNVELLEAN